VRRVFNWLLPWLFWILLKLPFFEKAVLALDLKAIMRQGFEKVSDKEIEQAIKDLKEGDWSKEPYASIMALLQKAGITNEVMLNWLETEKFLREHRRKYHPEHSKGEAICAGKGAQHSPSDAP